MKKYENSYLGNRYEFKYVLDHRKAARIKSYIEKVGLKSDSFSKSGAYIVNSMYFETPFLDDYYDKDASLLVRKKMRARMYEERWNDNLNNVWLEIKGKRNFKISKKRQKISGNCWNNFLATGSPLSINTDGIDEEGKSVLYKFSYLYLKGRYKPNIIVKYRRDAYLDYFTAKIRVTFDYDIETCFAREDMGENFMTPVFQDKVIMEIKFTDQLPWWFSTANDIFDLQRKDFSKYVHSVASLRNSYRIPVSR